MQFQLPRRESPHIGEIISPKQRVEMVREFKKNHFSLTGGGKLSTPLILSCSWSLLQVNDPDPFLTSQGG